MKVYISLDIKHRNIPGILLKNRFFMFTSRTIFFSCFLEYICDVIFRYLFNQYKIHKNFKNTLR